jgi:hypothetical protein
MAHRYGWIGLVGLAALLSGCVAADPVEVADVADVPTDTMPQVIMATPEHPTHGTLSRERARRMDAIIHQIVATTRPAGRAVRRQLDEAVAALDVPEQLVSNAEGLRTWREADRDLRAEVVGALYDSALDKLDKLTKVAMVMAELQGKRLTSAPSPLDEGPTGDPVVDTRLVSLEEIIAGAMAYAGLESTRELERGRTLELLPVFNSHGTEGADEAMGGRIEFFIGGGESSALPRCVMTFRRDDGDADGYRFAQVVRYRVMRGDEIIEDIDWRAAPTSESSARGFPVTELWNGILIAPSLEPIIDRNAEGFESLLDCMVRVDCQTALIDPAGQVLGGVDWRIEFSVSRRGSLTWEPAGEVFDTWCSEVKRVLGR